MIPVTLARPCWELRESYIECLKDFQTETPSRPIRWDWLENFELYMDWVKKAQECPDVVEEDAPETNYWIVWQGREAVGKLTFRHRLTPRLEKLGGHFGYEIRPQFRRRGIAKQAFALGLQCARSAGLQEVVVTCDDDNLGSIRILEANGGVLVDTYPLPDWPKLVRKYQFSLRS